MREVTETKLLTMSEIIARSLRQDMLIGKMRPGTRITQDDVSDQFAVSRMPARDALRQLLTEGFLRQDGRIVRVAVMTEADIREMVELDAFMHGLAAQGAAHCDSDDFRAELKRLEHEVDGKLSSGDMAGASELNWQFHRHINHFGASQHLRSVLRFISTPREHIAEAGPDAKGITREHASIVKAIVTGDGTAAREAAYAHVVASIEDRIRHLRSLGILK
jgi:DNA-binding GntR family transcriptional regulator